MKLIAAIDQGTTSTRCILFDHTSAVASAQKEHRQIFPQSGWVEHDVEEIWHSTCEVIRQAMSRARAAAADIAAVGITNQRETVIAWNRHTGKPYYNALVWQDTRTADMCTRLAADGGGDRFRAATGLPISTYFSATKIRWLLDNVPEFRRDAQAPGGPAVVGTVDAFLHFKLAAPSADLYPHTDVTNASRTMLMNLHTQNWDDDLCAAFGVPRHILPVIAPSYSNTPLALTDPRGPFAGEVPIAAILGDQQAALFGQTCFNLGECKNTYGTGNFLLMNTGTTPVASTHGLLTTVACTAGATTTFALEGSVAVTGSLVQWLRDNLGLFAHAADIEALAAAVADSGNVVIVPAFSGLFAPYWRPDARGTICGLTRYTTKAHLARAALEAVAFQTRDVLSAMDKDCHSSLSPASGNGKLETGNSLKVDGGMTGNNLLLQIQADTLGMSVLRPRIIETTALGAAFAAGLSVGYFQSQADLRRHWQLDRRFDPVIDEPKREAACTQWKKALERSLGWA
jgi:glycerol kinase